MYLRFYKPLIDTLAAFVLIIVVAPILVITALAIFIEDGSPIIFIHERVGAHNKTFRIFKFRSMKKNTQILTSDKVATTQVTCVGRIIRRLNIDELPQLMNVILQDMSLVGPRPCLSNQEHLIEARQINGSSSLKPGITGLAQINSYDGMSVDAKSKFDGQYCRSVSLFTDLQILFSTFRYVTKKPPTY